MNISVVIPAYNAESFLGDTIRAARAQTLAPLEIIVVDDGSTDATSDVAKALGCRVIRQANGGVCVARNTGILAARGDWIALLDHDDLWLPEKLERQAAAVALHTEAGCVATDFVRLRDGHTDPVSCLESPEYRLESLTMVPLADDVVYCPRAGEELLTTGWFLFPSSMLIRRDILLAAGMFRPEQRLCEDVDCLLRVMRHTSLLLVRVPLWRWRQHDRNTSRDQTGIAEGWLRLAQYVRTEPEAYPPGTDARLPSILRDIRRSLVAEYTARHDFSSARRVSRTPIGGSITPRDAVLAVVVELPPAIWGMLRRARSVMRAFSLRL